jgi:hypothetical protein
MRPGDLILLLLLLAGVARADRIEEIDGTLHVDLRILSIEPGSIVFTRIGEEEELRLPRADVRQVILQHSPALLPGPAQVRVWTTDGSVLEGKLAPAPPGTLTIESRLHVPATFAFEHVQALRYLASGVDAGAGFDRELETRSAAEDVLFVRSPEGTQVRIPGLVERVEPDAVEISWEGATRTVPRDRLVGLVFAAGGQQAAGPEHAARLQLVGGRAELLGALEHYDGESLTLRLACGVRLQLHARAVVRITFLTDRIAYLSDLEPTAVREQPFFDRGWGYRRDRNVHGGALRLGRVTYEKGLGVHSACALEYEIDPRFTHLTATIGLDDAAHGLGGVTFRVLLDGEQAGAWSLNAQQRPQRVVVPLAGARRLVLEVGYGEDGLDVGDVADWADAKLISSPDTDPGQE